MVDGLRLEEGCGGSENVDVVEEDVEDCSEDGM